MSDFVIENLFPTSIYRTNLVDMGVQEEIDGVINQVQFVETPQHWGKTHKVNKPKNGDLVFNQDFLHDYNLSVFQTHLKFHVKNYMKKLNIVVADVYKKQSWITLFEKNDYGHIHNHGTADIAGAYYYSTNGKDGDIFFSNPNLACSTSIFKNMQNRVSVNPRVGDLILFPGFLNHGITRNETDNRRMSISFNIYFEKEIGW